jgi:hypothetical protein
LLLSAPTAFADQCGTGPGWQLDVPATASLGTTADVDMTGPANEMGLLFVSDTTGSVLTPYGNICVGFPILFAVPFDFDANGVAQISGDIPCDPSFIGVTVYLQFITCAPNKGSSNLGTLTITDGVCSGDLCTFTQGAWGSKCHGGNAGCIRNQWFSTVFPNGVLVGDQDGLDGDSAYALLFTSGSSLEQFLPAGGTAAALRKDATDPKSSDAGVFAGQLLAAHVNVAFDDAGALDGCKGRKDLKLGDLVFVSGVDSHLIGWTVRDLITICDEAISGELGSGPFDLDGDGVGDVSFSDLSDALDVLNNDYDEGKQDNGHLGLP